MLASHAHACIQHRRPLYHCLLHHHQHRHRRHLHHHHQDSLIRSFTILPSIHSDALILHILFIHLPSLHHASSFIHSLGILQAPTLLPPQGMSHTPPAYPPGAPSLAGVGWVWQTTKKAHRRAAGLYDPTHVNATFRRYPCRFCLFFSRLRPRVAVARVTAQVCSGPCLLSRLFHKAGWYSGFFQKKKKRREKEGD